jgi:hypothetical protein
LLDQVKIITIKQPTDNFAAFLPYNSIKYALELADTIRIQVNAYHLNYPILVHNMLESVWISTTKKTENIEL